MSASPLSVAVAERVERRSGPRAALVVWKGLADLATSSEVRIPALLSAMRCAIAIGDLSTFAALTNAWSDAGGADVGGRVATQCLALARQGQLSAGLALAGAEVRRWRSARALYVHARLLETSGDRRAEAAFAEVIDAARTEGLPVLANGARRRRALLLSRTSSDSAAAIEEAKAIDLRLLPPAHRISIARVLLRAPGRFVRAGAIAALDGVVSLGDVRLATRALAACAEHVDAAGDRLSALEVDRLSAVFARDIALALAPCARAALLVATRIARAADDEIDVVLDELGLQRASVSALAPLAASAERGERVPPQAWNLARLGLEQESADMHEVAARFVKAELEDESVRPPPRGWLELAEPLTARGMHELAERVLRRAVSAGEPGGEDALLVALTTRAWGLASSGDRARALAFLEEARALASRSS